VARGTLRKGMLDNLDMPELAKLLTWNQKEKKLAAFKDSCPGLKKKHFKIKIFLIDNKNERE